MSRTRAFLALAITASTVTTSPGFSTGALQGHPASWHIEQKEQQLDGASGVRETRWRSERRSEGATDQIEVHRFRGQARPSATLVYLPGTNMNGEAAVIDEDHNLWIYLARRGVEVFTLDYRAHFLTDDDLTDSTVLSEWSLELFAEDARAAVDLALRESAGPVFLAGFSRGVSIAYAVASTESSADASGGASNLAGLVVLDGSFKSYAPKSAFDLESSLAATVESGSFAADVAAGFGWERRAQLMEAVIRDPSAPPLWGDSSETVGDQLAEVLYRAWGPGGLANPIDGVSDVEVLARLLADYDRYYPTVQNAQGASIADYADDPQTTIDDGWGELEIPILYFGATGMGNEWLLNGIYSAAKSGSRDVEIHVLEGYGHLDVLVGERAAEEVFAPTLAWMKERAR